MENEDDDKFSSLQEELDAIESLRKRCRDTRNDSDLLKIVKRMRSEMDRPSESNVEQEVPVVEDSPSESGDEMEVN